jgi:hypothetical protein
MNVDLMPCPFCGGHPEFCGEYVRCAECMTEGPWLEPSGSEGDEQEAAVFKSWNTRIAAGADAEVARLRAALTSITNRYCDLAESGDCGFWDPEDEDEVKQARAAIAPDAPA